jgi:CheY-like chemotaxis protein
MNVRSILLVDDDADDQYVFVDALNSVYPNINVSTAIDGIDALEKLAAKKDLPELIFLDLNMPRMNGKTFLKEIKSSHVLNDIPVIVYSTSSNPADIAETKELGARELITKRNSYDKLCSVLSSVLESQ